MEKRKSSRARSLLAGRIIFNNRTSVIDCTVRDISDTGAKTSRLRIRFSFRRNSSWMSPRGARPFACTSGGPTEMITAFRS